MRTALRKPMRWGPTMPSGNRWHRLKPMPLEVRLAPNFRRAGAPKCCKPGGSGRTPWYVPPAVSGWRVTSGAVAASAVIGLALAGCGGGSSQAASEPSGNFRVDVSSATFPVRQALAQHSDMVITVRNAGSKAIPDIAVTITDGGDGTSAQPFSEVLHTPGLADPSRAVWVVDQAPCPAKATDITRSGECAPVGPGGVRETGGPGGAVTAYSNTWAMGRLSSGHRATFKWGVTAVQPGVHVIHYRIAAGLNGKAKAVAAGGQPLAGTFVVNIAAKPRRSYVNDAGQIVNVP
jgi:hypothetical protein